jgi:hypothetical protein
MSIVPETGQDGQGYNKSCAMNILRIARTLLSADSRNEPNYRL